MEKGLNEHTFRKMNVECYKMKSGIEKKERQGRGTVTSGAQQSLEKGMLGRWSV